MPPGRNHLAADALVPCRACAEPVEEGALTCPHCGAPRPSRAVFTGEGYVWRSQREWLGEPLLHIAFGMDAAGRPRVARGVIAVGQRAMGGIAVGILACGFISLGVVSLGLVSAGVVAVACGAAFGVNALAPLAVGVSAIGYAAYGVAAIGFLTHAAPGGSH